MISSSCLSQYIRQKVSFYPSPKKNKFAVSKTEQMMWFLVVTAKRRAQLTTGLGAVSVAGLVTSAALMTSSIIFALEGILHWVPAELRYLTRWAAGNWLLGLLLAFLRLFFTLPVRGFRLPNICFATVHVTAAAHIASVFIGTIAAAHLLSLPKIIDPQHLNTPLAINGLQLNYSCCGYGNSTVTRCPGCSTHRLPFSCCSFYANSDCLHCDVIASRYDAASNRDAAASAATRRPPSCDEVLPASLNWHYGLELLGALLLLGLVAAEWALARLLQTALDYAFYSGNPLGFTVAWLSPVVDREELHRFAAAARRRLFQTGAGPVKGKQRPPAGRHSASRRRQGLTKEDTNWRPGKAGRSNPSRLDVLKIAGMCRDFRCRWVAILSAAVDECPTDHELEDRYGAPPVPPEPPGPGSVPVPSARTRSTQGRDSSLADPATAQTPAATLASTTAPSLRTPAPSRTEPQTNVTQ